MKALKYILFLSIITGLALSSCKNDEDEIKEPDIKFIRVTNPDQADSLIEKASMGRLVVLMGSNLNNVMEVWFNDQKAVVVPTYVTESSIMVNIPSLPPQEINDKITLVLRDGRKFEFPFVVTVPAPVLSGIKCEYVPDGGTVELYGNFFFDPVVYFPGEVQAEILEFTQQSIKVKVPEGAQKGPFEVRTKFGKVKSKFKFRDDTGLFWDFDTKLGAGWHWHADHLQNTGPAGISGNYYKLEANYADWGWDDSHLEADLWGQSAGRPNGPLWEGGISGKAIRFEVNVVENWGGGFLQFIFLPWNNNNNSGHSDNKIAKGLWRPWQSESGGLYKTDGWITKTIPLSEFKFAHDGSDAAEPLKYPDNTGSLSIFVRGPVPAAAGVNHVFICIDNIRVVDL
jgi:hypothetical protein